VDLLGIRRVPFMARRNYVIELQHMFLWGVFAGLVEGTVSAVVASKTFNGSWLLITVVQATPAFANLVSLYWGAMIVGRPKVRALQLLGAASVLMTLSVALTPRTYWGGWIFASQICMARVFMTGVVTARASLWKSNYPKSHRGRITAALQVVRTLMSLPVILGCGMLFDYDPMAYRWFYPVIGIIGAAGLVLPGRSHVRGEKASLASRARQDDDVIAESGLDAPFTLVALISPGHIIGRMREALKQDPQFARYCRAQWCIGAANLMMMPVNTIVLTRVMQLSYTVSNALLDVIPKFVTLLMLPIWARLFDRVGVLRFRVINSMCWSASILLCGVGTLLAGLTTQPWDIMYLAALYVFFLGRLADGMGQSGGAIAWNIGHLHFAEGDKAELYMGIHVSLTGVRGLTAPFVGSLLFAWMGWGVFVPALVASMLGHSIFSSLAREEAGKRLSTR
jgi:hypothetical protein